MPIGPNIGPNGLGHFEPDHKRIDHNDRQDHASYTRPAPSDACIRPVDIHDRFGNIEAGGDGLHGGFEG